jgi:hypothetical protein
MRVELEKAIDAAKTHIVGIEATPGAVGSSSISSI